MDFNMLETAAKNILIYKTFNKESWDQKTKKCGYWYTDQVSKNWKLEIQMKQLII